MKYIQYLLRTTSQKILPIMSFLLSHVTAAIETLGKHEASVLSYFDADYKEIAAWSDVSVFVVFVVVCCGVVVVVVAFVLGVRVL